MIPPMPSCCWNWSASIRQKLKPWRPADEHTRTLQFLVEHRRKLVNDKTRLTNRLTSVLKGYFPHVLRWFAALDTPLVCDFLKRWPTLEARPEDG